MTERQVAALQRILEREAVAYRTLADRPAPGQHPSQDKWAVSDGDICILLHEPLPNLPMSVRADSLARFVQNERKRELHFPVPANQIDRSYWARLIGQGGNRPQGVELSAPILRPDQLVFDDSGVAEPKMEVSGKFDAQLLIDAIDVVGCSPLVFIGAGLLDGHYPPLLMMPPLWTEQNCAEPLALILPYKYD